MKKQGLFIILTMSSLLLFSQSKVETHTFFSPSLGVEKSYSIYLPDGYDSDTSQQYPSLYFFRCHESEWFDASVRSDNEELQSVADNLISEGKIGKMILIGPSTGGNNSDIYSQDWGIVNMLRPDLADDSGIGTGAFEDYIIFDLIPHIDTTFRTIPEWCARGVDGFSLGGYTSTLYGLKHPGVFSSVGNYDGSLMWYKLDNPNTPGPHDDDIWMEPFYATYIAPMFGQPFDTTYMESHSATQVLLAADSLTLDSIKQISFHISTKSSVINSNRPVNQQLVDSLFARGIQNSFTELPLSSNAIHTWDFADEHAKKSLLKHWATFLSHGCTQTTLIDDLTSSTIPFSIYPNPADTWSEIEFELSKNSNVRIDLLDVQGRTNILILNKAFKPGVHTIKIDVSSLVDGLYIYRLQIPGKPFITHRFIKQ